MDAEKRMAPGVPRYNPQIGGVVKSKKLVDGVPQYAKSKAAFPSTSAQVKNEYERSGGSPAGNAAGVAIEKNIPVAFWRYKTNRLDEKLIYRMQQSQVTRRHRRRLP